MERLLAIWIKELSAEAPDGSTLRTTLSLIDALQIICPFTEVIRLGLFVLPIRGPSRFYGGDEGVLNAVTQCVKEVSGFTPSLGVGEGLFCAEVAAKQQVVLPPGTSDFFRNALPLEYLERKDLATTCHRLGLHTIGAFAALEPARIGERFNKHALLLHAVARGQLSELPGQRDVKLGQRLREERGEGPALDEQTGFFGQRGASDQRAEAAAHRVRRRLGVDAVLSASLQGGRSPEDRATLMPWGSPEARSTPEAPWPGVIGAPSPATTFSEPVGVQLRNSDDENVAVLSRGLLNADPSTLVFSSAARRHIVWFAGPWPVLERWWQTGRKRAHLQVLLEGGEALLLSSEKNRWWLVGIYD